MKLFVIGGPCITKQEPQFPDQLKLLRRSMRRLGRDVIQANHDLLVCSPFADSADVEAVRGAAEALGEGESPCIEFHYPGAPNITQELESLLASLPSGCVRLFKYHPPIDPESSEARTHAWLLAQLSAMNRSHAVVAIGGKPTGSASLLLLLAEGQGKSVLPLTFLEGAAAQSFQRRQYELRDRLHDDLAALHDPNRIGETVTLIERLTSDRRRGLRRTAPTCFFISYPRSRPQEADYVEMILRRRGVEVLRDDQDFRPGSPLEGEIREYINKCDHFIAIWCRSTPAVPGASTSWG